MKKIKLGSLLISSMLIILLVGCASSSSNKENNNLTNDDKIDYLSKVTEKKPEDKNPIATIEMENGEKIKIELYPEIAPNTVRNFITLSNNRFYDGLTFHRVIENFMIQGGDPLGNGTGGPDYSIYGEFSNNNFENSLSHKRGVISMARSLKNNNSAGSQFFIMHKDNQRLDGDYAAFGEVIDGMDTVDSIATTETKNEKPIKDIRIKSITIDTFGVNYNEPYHYVK